MNLTWHARQPPRAIRQRNSVRKTKPSRPSPALNDANIARLQAYIKATETNIARAKKDLDVAVSSPVVDGDYVLLQHLTKLFNVDGYDYGFMKAPEPRNSSN